MYYFENDPLKAVYDDLWGDKSPSQFDCVLNLQGSLQTDFMAASGHVYIQPLLHMAPVPSGHFLKTF